MYSLHIPSDRNYIISKMINIATSDFTNIVNLTLQSVNENNYKNINFKLLSLKLSMTSKEVEDLFGMLFILIRWCQQLKSHSDREIKNDLIEQGLPVDWTNNFLNLILNKENKVWDYNNCMLQMDNYTWRIDISLYGNALKRALSPTIIWKITLSDGKQYTIEINVSRFHELRFNISTLLKEIGIVKTNNLVK